MRVLIAGCGYVGTQIGRLLAAKGVEVWGVRREPAGLPEAIRPVAVDLLDPDLAERIPQVERVVYAAAADASTPKEYRAAYVDGVRNLMRALDAVGAPVERFLFLSSTAVYGEAHGERVDEETPPRPVSFRGEVVLEGEGCVLGAAARAAGRARGGVSAEAGAGSRGGGEGAPSLAGVSTGGIILRLGGIYGPGRTRLIERVRAGEDGCAEGVVEWSNRIHRDDAAGAACHLLLHPEPESIYIGVDDAPAPLCDVHRFVQGLLGARPADGEGRPEEIAAQRTAAGGPGSGGGRSDIVADAGVADTVSTAGAGGADAESTVDGGGAPARGKRCSNLRLRASGYEFRYPSYREGYASMLDRVLREREGR